MRVLSNGLTVGRGAGAVSTNTAVGASALAANTSGADNVAIGRSAASGATTASFGTYVGSLSGNSGITGNNNTALGYYAYGSGSTGANNTALGVQALYLNTTGSNNTALGYQAGYTSTTNGYITAIGDSALYANTQAFNTAVGGLAAAANDTGYIAAFGSATLQNNTTGTGNAGFGSYDNAVATLRNNSTGSYNSAFGFGALQANTTASYNTALGYQALYSNVGGDGTTAATNTAVGYQAGYLNQIGYNAVFIGNLAGYTNATGANNVYVGNQAGYTATASNNTFLGNAAGSSVTSGAKNTIVGQYSGNQSGLDIRTASNYIVLSDGDGNPLVSTADNQTVALEGAVPNSGTGITFPATQSASSNANTLDDYEEGSWTPVAIGGTTTGTGTYSLQVGRYTKIGQVCFFQMTLGWSAHTGTGDLILAGLPFTSLNAGGGGGQSVATLGYNNGLAFTNQPVMFIPTNNTRISLTQTTTGGTVTSIPMDTAVSELVVNGHYIIA
jgi:trimeric autotransporter adhesin